MAKELTKEELEILWVISFDDEDAEMCFIIDDEYKARFGLYAWQDWLSRRI